MAGERRARGEALEQRRRRVFVRWALGKNQMEQAAEEGVDQKQISRDLAAAFASMAGKIGPEHVEAALLEMLGKIAHAEAELLAAWERSKKPRERRTGKQIKPSGGRAGREEGTKLIEGRDGSVRFMTELRALWELKAKILGLIVHKVAPTDPSGSNEYVGLTAEERSAIREQLDSRLGRRSGVAPAAESTDASGPPVAGPDAGDAPGWLDA